MGRCRGGRGMDKKKGPTGIRPKQNGIDIRWSYKGKPYSSFENNKAWNPTNVQWAIRLRKQYILDTKERVTADYISRDNPTFKQVAEDFISVKATGNSKHRKFAHRVLITHKQSLKKYWYPQLANRRIKEITVGDVQMADGAYEWEHRLNQHIIVRQSLYNVFKYAMNNGYNVSLLSENPTKSLYPITKPKRPEINPFTVEEKNRILAEIAKEGAQAYLFYLLHFECGLRTGELLGLEHSDFQDHKLLVRRSIVDGEIKGLKTEHTGITSREVELSTRAIKAFKKYPRDIEGYMWRNGKGTRQLSVTYNNSNRWRAALQRANVPYRRPYNCRHTYASIGLTAGMSSEWLANQLGHSVVTFHKHYAKLIPSHLDTEFRSKIEDFEKNVSGINLGISDILES